MVETRKPSGGKCVVCSRDSEFRTWEQKRQKQVLQASYIEKETLRSKRVCNLFWTIAWFFFSHLYIEQEKITYPSTRVWSCRRMRQRKYSGFLVLPYQSSLFFKSYFRKVLNKTKSWGMTTMAEDHESQKLPDFKEAASPNPCPNPGSAVPGLSVKNVHFICS